MGTHGFRGWIARITIAIVLLIAATMKVLDYPWAVNGIVQWSALVAFGRSGSTQAVVVILEVALSLLLLSSRWRLGAALASVLFLLFLSYLATLVFSGIDVRSCGCFGGRELAPSSHFVLLLGLNLLCLYLLSSPHQEEGKR